MEQRAERTIGDLVFVGFNRWVVALDRYSGEIVWEWKSPKASGRGLSPPASSKHVPRRAGTHDTPATINA